MTDETRQKVVAQAILFLNVPYIHNGRNTGGMDCIGLIVETFERAGVIPHVDLPYYSEQWALNHSEELYLNHIKQYCREVIDRKPLPADILLYQFGRCVSHGALVLDYPRVIHASKPDGSVVYADDGQGWLSSMRYKGCWEVVC